MTTPSPDTSKPGNRGKSRWPVGIAIGLLAVVLINVALVVVARNNRSSLVRPDYYDKGLAWDGEIDARVSPRIEVSLDLTRDRSLRTVVSTVATDISLTDSLTVHLICYRPDNPAQDTAFYMVRNNDDSGRLHFSAPAGFALPPGYWEFETTLRFAETVVKRDFAIDSTLSRIVPAPARTRS